MKKKLIATITLFSILFSPFAHADHETTFYSDEDEEFFNRGKVVEKESDEYLRIRRRNKMKSWALALGTTAVGIATVILVGKNHHHSDHRR